MGMMDIMFWPFAFAFSGAMFLLWLVVVLFWIWMLIDCAKRRFRSDAEKVIWIIVIALCNWIGALVYFIVIRSINAHGLARR